MTKEFKQKLKNYPFSLYYNTKGSPLAYKLSIRHLSSASYFNEAILAGDYLFPKDRLHIVNFENESIDSSSLNI